MVGPGAAELRPEPLRADGAVLATGSWDGTARLRGLDVLDEAPEALGARIPQEWGLRLEEALVAAER